MSEEPKELQVVSTIESALSPAQVQHQVQMIQQVMNDVMQEGEHYGMIPGTKKNTLFKAGAEKLLLTFRLAPEYEVMAETEKADLVSYQIRCRLIHIPTQQFVGSGLGACNSQEKKYRSSVNAFDIQNTVFKMACKRALIAAVLNATAASDCFTQDLEDNAWDAPKPTPKTNYTANGGVISEGQRKRLYAMWKSANLADAFVQDGIKSNWGYDNTKDITKDDYQAICDWIGEQGGAA